MGVVLFIAAFPLLWWNEGRAVKTAKGLKEAGGAVVSTTADKVDSAQDKKLIHLTAKATTDETVKDEEFAVSAAAIKLRRKVEMYQWKEAEKSEKKKELGGSEKTVKTYTYKEEWSEDEIDSSRFKKTEGHANPGKMRFAKAEKIAEKVTLGAFRMSPGLLGQLSEHESLPFRSEDVEKLPEAVKKQAKVDGNQLYLPNDAASKAVDPAKPKVGDLRISFQIVKPATVSILARQLGDTFEPWKSATGTQIERLMLGEVSAENMIGKMESENAILTWILRGVGFLVMAFGIGMVFSPFAVFADVIPFLGDLMRMGTGLFAGVIAFGLSLTTIAVAWLAYRPVLGIGLIVVSIGAVWFIRKLGANKRKLAAA